MLSSRFGYVTVSRASHEATIFTDDVTRLAHQLGTELTKTGALEIVPKLSATEQQSIGMGL